jgi:hypothetical protein
MSTYLPRPPGSQRIRLQDRALARLLGPMLDRQLAAGHPAEIGWSRVARARTARARRLVSPAGRRQLVRGWARLLDQAGRPPVPRSPRGPLCRLRLIAAEPDVRVMLGVVTGPRPVAARGAALARQLLIDGTGPLYNAHTARDLAAEVRAATRWLDPSAPAGLPIG